MTTTFLARRLAAVVVTGMGTLVLTAVPAWAHVSVSSPDAEPGGFGKLVFRVPNESDTASTTKLTVELPTDTPFAEVSTKSMPGWRVEAEPEAVPKPVKVSGATVTDAVTRVTWTAEKGHALAPGQFGEFELSLGTFPEGVESMSFPATQTYSDGEVVRWNDPVKPGATEAEEPEHPAPTLALASTDLEATGLTSAPQATADSSDDVARRLAGGAVLLGAAALLAALRPRPRRRA